MTAGEHSEMHLNGILTGFCHSSETAALSEARPLAARRLGR